MSKFTFMVRFLHIASAVYNLLFIYSPLHQWQHGFTTVQYLSTPLLIVTGVLMVRGRKKYQQRTAAA